MTKLNHMKFFNGTRAASRVQGRFAQICRPPKARVTRASWTYPQFTFSITPSADP